jgi:hypothetical protein
MQTGLFFDLTFSKLLDVAIFEYICAVIFQLEYQIKNKENFRKFKIFKIKIIIFRLIQLTFHVCIEGMYSFLKNLRVKYQKNWIICECVDK